MQNSLCIHTTSVTSQCVHKKWFRMIYFCLHDFIVKDTDFHCVLSPCLWPHVFPINSSYLFTLRFKISLTLALTFCLHLHLCFCPFHFTVLIHDVHIYKNKAWLFSLLLSVALSNSIAFDLLNLIYSIYFNIIAV